MAVWYIVTRGDGGEMSGIRVWWVASAVLAILVLSALARPASAVNVSNGGGLPGVATWTVQCPNGGGSWTWSWLDSGSAITNQTFSGGCGSSGSSAIPAGANGITATVFAFGGCFGYSGPCPFTSQSKTVTKAVDPTKSFKLSIQVSATVRNCDITGCKDFKNTINLTLDYTA